MCRTVFTEADGVMGEYKNRAQLHQCRHAKCISGVFRKHQEGAAIGNESTMQGEAIDYRRHAEFAHTEKNVVAFAIPADGL